MMLARVSTEIQMISSKTKMDQIIRNY